MLKCAFGFVNNQIPKVLVCQTDLLMLKLLLEMHLKQQLLLMFKLFNF